MEYFLKPSIDEKQETMLVVVNATWMDPILNYSKDSTLLEDKVEAKLLRFPAVST